METGHEHTRTAHLARSAVGRATLLFQIAVEVEMVLERGGLRAKAAGGAVTAIHNRRSRRPTRKSRLIWHTSSEHRTGIVLAPKQLRYSGICERVEQVGGDP